jgi:hypothetical protein
MEKVGPALDDALGGADQLRAPRTDEARCRLGNQGGQGLPCRADAGHVRQVAIGLEHDILPPLDGLLAEGAPDLVGHVPKRYGGRFSERKSRPRRPRSRQPHVCKSGIVGLVDSPGHARAAVARHPHDSPLDAGVQVAAAAVLGEEGVEIAEQTHRVRRISTLTCAGPRHVARGRWLFRTSHPRPQTLGAVKFTSLRRRPPWRLGRLEPRSHRRHRWRR